MAPGLDRSQGGEERVGALPHGRDSCRVGGRLAEDVKQRVEHSRPVNPLARQHGLDAPFDLVERCCLEFRRLDQPADRPRAQQVGRGAQIVLPRANRVQVAEDRPAGMRTHITGPTREQQVADPSDRGGCGHRVHQRFPQPDLVDVHLLHRRETDATFHDELSARASLSDQT